MLCVWEMIKIDPWYCAILQRKRVQRYPTSNPPLSQILSKFDLMEPGLVPDIFGAFLFIFRPRFSHFFPPVF